MAEAPRKDARSGGSLLAISVIAGAVGGTLAGQASIGFLIGVAIGLALLLLVWLIDRRNR